MRYRIQFEGTTIGQEMGQFASPTHTQKQKTKTKKTWCDWKASNMLNRQES